MIPVPSGVRVWLAVGHTDMRRGMNSLALQVQEGLKRDPHPGDLYVFRGRRGHLIKILWHDLQLEGYGPKNIPRWWGQRVGGYKMGLGLSQITYWMSAREPLEMLSGRKTIREFNEENGFNPFENALQRGLTIMR